MLHKIQQSVRVKDIDPLTLQVSSLEANLYTKKIAIFHIWTELVGLPCFLQLPSISYSIIACSEMWYLLAKQKPNEGQLESFLVALIQ